MKTLLSTSSWVTSNGSVPVLLSNTLTNQKLIFQAIMVPKTTGK